MMKINLSGDKENNESEKTIAAAAPPDEATVSSEAPEEFEDEVIEEIAPADNKRKKILLGALLAVVVLAAGFMYKDTILNLFPQEAEVIAPIAPPPPPPPPEPEVVKAEPDPAFVTLNRLGEAVTPRLWLTSAIIKYDGSYKISGMAFSHKSMNDMLSALEGIGTVTSKSIPAKLKSAEAVYNFSIGGTLGNVDVPEILDVIPTENLVASAESVKSRDKEFDVKFSSLPKSGATYGDTDMPFTLVGSYEGLKNTISVLCPEGSETRIFNISITPRESGRVFDTIKASFSLKTVSSI